MPDRYPVALVTCWLLATVAAAAAMTWYVVRRYVLKSTFVTLEL